MEEEEMMWEYYYYTMEEIYNHDYIPDWNEIK